MVNSIALFVIVGIISVIMGSSVSAVSANCPLGKIPKTNSNGVPIIDPNTHMPICVTNGKLPVPPPH